MKIEIPWRKPVVGLVVPGTILTSPKRYLILECGHTQERLTMYPVPKMVSCGTCWREQESSDG